MEERSAIGTAWGNLTGVNDGGFVIRIVFFIVFIGGTVFAIISYLNGSELVQLETATALPGVDHAQADRNRLQAMIAQVETTSHARSGSRAAVVLIEQSFALYPFNEPRFDITPPPPPPNGTIVVVPEVIIEYPPHMTLRGIMVMGGQQVAVMDITGVGNGMVVRAGDTFAQRRGRVVRIAADRVVVNWAGRNWDIAPSF